MEQILINLVAGAIGGVDTGKSSSGEATCNWANAPEHR